MWLFSNSVNWPGCLSERQEYLRHGGSRTPFNHTWDVFVVYMHCSSEKVGVEKTFEAWLQMHQNFSGLKQQRGKSKAECDLWKLFTRVQVLRYLGCWCWKSSSTFNLWNVTRGIWKMLLSLMKCRIHRRMALGQTGRQWLAGTKKLKSEHGKEILSLLRYHPNSHAVCCMTNAF